MFTYPCLILISSNDHTLQESWHLCERKVRSHRFQDLEMWENRFIALLLLVDIFKSFYRVRYAQWDVLTIYNSLYKVSSMKYTVADQKHVSLTSWGSCPPVSIFNNSFYESMQYNTEHLAKLHPMHAIWLLYYFMDCSCTQNLLSSAELSFCQFKFQWGCPPVVRRILPL